MVVGLHPDEAWTWPCCEALPHIGIKKTKTKRKEPRLSKFPEHFLLPFPSVVPFPWCQSHLPPTSASLALPSRIQATEAIVDVALTRRRAGVPLRFAVVPCCVFAERFPRDLAGAGVCRRRRGFWPVFLVEELGLGPPRHGSPC